MLNDDQWKLIDDQYGMLMKKICHKISGDNAIANFDDNFQDLQIAALEAVAGYERQNNGQNGEFNDFWGSKGFDQYIKTVLWNHKNSKGKNISKRYHITRDTVSVSNNEEVIKMEDDKSNSFELSLFLRDINDALPTEESNILRELVQSPNLIKPNGRVNLTLLAHSQGETVYEVRKHLENIAIKINNEL